MTTEKHYTKVQAHEGLTSHQKSVITQTLDSTFPLLSSGAKDSYIRDVWTSASTVNVAINDVSTAQFQHIDLSEIDNIDHVQTQDGTLVIAFECHGTTYELFIREKREEVN